MKVTADEREELEAVIRKRSGSAALVRRARCVQRPWQRDGEREALVLSVCVPSAKCSTRKRKSEKPSDLASHFTANSSPRVAISA